MDKKLNFPEDFKEVKTNVFQSKDKSLRIALLKRLWQVFYLDTDGSKPEYRAANFKRGFSTAPSPEKALQAYYLYKRSGLVTANDVTELHTFKPVDLSDDSEHEPLFDQDYVPAKEDPAVSKTIEILNGLCKKYKYAMLKNHEVVSEDEMTFFIDYHFNGKEVGTVSFEMDKNSNGRWSVRCYLSVKRAAKLPMTNVALFISDFKRLVQSLHIAIGEQQHIS